ncbi:transcription factor S [Haloglomus litoreum]|uniref:transcription factor S n=1 Tax=Haloglomus litoreum TaxID=3034026 RepID=UPI0023E85DE7|nr:transcription factor S [Haloglomus sp. DT116]
MKFCDECGSMMHSGKDEATWVCRSCGHEEGRGDDDSETMTTTEGQSDDGPVDMSEVDDEEIGPTTTVICPECGHDRARYEMKQIRAADESETRFFTCTECGQKWREDDH